MPEPAKRATYPSRAASAFALKLQIKNHNLEILQTKPPSQRSWRSRFYISAVEEWAQVFGRRAALEGALKKQLNPAFSAGAGSIKQKCRQARPESSPARSVSGVPGACSTADESPEGTTESVQMTLMSYASTLVHYPFVPLLFKFQIEN